MLKSFLAAITIHLIVQGHFALQSWTESLPFTDSWAYFRNYHPVRHMVLEGLRWASLVAAVLLGASLLVKRRWG